jgi:SAM-dependent methyltransferase
MKTLFVTNWNKLLEIVTVADQETRCKTLQESDYTPFVKVFAEYCPPDEYSYILNIGAGEGLETLALLKYPYLSVDALNFGENINDDIPGLSFNIDMHNLKILLPIISDHNKYDAIFTLQTFEHALAPFMLILECRRVLRDGGRIFIDVPDPDDQVMLETLQHSSVLYANQWKALFTKAGFKVVADLSVKHRLQFFFEKLSDGSFPTWEKIKNYYK